MGGKLTVFIHGCAKNSYRFALPCPMRNSRTSSTASSSARYRRTCRVLTPNSNANTACRGRTWAGPPGTGGSCGHVPEHVMDGVACLLVNAPINADERFTAVRPAASQDIRVGSDIAE